MSREMSNRIGIVVIVVMGLIIVTTIALVISGKAAIVWKDMPSDSVKVVSRVCGDAEIAAYNNIFESDSRSEYNKRFDTVARTVEGLPGYQSDVTCVYMLFSYYLNKQKDISKAREYLSIVDRSAAEGVYASTKLADIQSVTTSQKKLEAMEKAQARGDSREPLPGQPGRGRG